MTKPVSKAAMKTALQWLRGEITTKEAKDRLNVKQVSQAVYKIGIALRAAFRADLLK
jgi:hypothetical protein